MKDYEGLSKAHFDAQAAVYDETDTVYYSKYPQISCRNVADRLHNHNYSKLLDAGCGTGYLIDILRKDSSSVFYGLDLSSEMLNMARRKFGGEVYLAQGSAQSLPYNNDVFYVVTCVQSFHHYPNPKLAMSEAYRVTASNGLYILSDTGCSGIAKCIDNLFMKLMKSGDYAAYDRYDIENLMKSAGFIIKDSVQVTKMIYTVVGQKEDKI